VPCIEKIEKELSYKIEYANEFYKIMQTKFFDLNNIQLEAAITLFKTKTFQDI